METKPYRIQSPENIAKDYGGNKQKIAEAMQMGVVDPTAGVLAGMFIDRMRSAQMQEMAPKPTVAQQVMGGAPSAPPLAGGLGATLPAAPPMAPDMGMAPPMEAPMPEEAPMGMAAGGMFEAPYMKDGGLSELPIPDGMFDENRDGGYAHGGIVAFAGAGEARSSFSRPGEYGSLIEELAVQTFPGLRVTSRQRSAAKNAQVGGVKNSFHQTGDARDFTPPEGVSMKDFAKSLKAKFGSNFDVIDEGDHVHVEPGSKADARASFPERNMQSAKGRASSLRDQIRGAKELFGELPDSGLDEAEEYYRKQISPEEKEKSRKYDMWQTLAQIGAGMASTSSPRFLQAAGQAMAAALPGAAASKKERTKAERDAIGALVDIAGVRRKEAKEVLEFGKDAHAIELNAEQAQTEREFRSSEAAKTRAFQADQARQEAALSERLAKLRINPSDMEGALRILQSGTEEEKAALREYYKIKGMYSSSGAGNMFGVNTGGEGGAPAGPWSQYQ